MLLFLDRDVWWSAGGFNVLIIGWNTSRRSTLWKIILLENVHQLILKQYVTVYINLNRPLNDGNKSYANVISTDYIFWSLCSWRVLYRYRVHNYVIWFMNTSLFLKYLKDFRSILVQKRIQCTLVYIYMLILLPWRQPFGLIKCGIYNNNAHAK